MMLTLLAIFLTIIIVVGLHEAGHALAAALFGVKIQRISIGFGKPIVCWKDKKDQEWVWAMWPLGGYVKLLNSRIQNVDPNNYPYCFDKQTAWRRIIILLAGAIANVLVALMALTLFYMLGYQQVLPVIQDVKPNSIAAEAGLKPHDRFLSINHWPTKSLQEVGNSFVINLGKPGVIATVIDSNQATRQVSLNLASKFNRTSKNLADLLGISFESSDKYKQTVAPQSFLAAIHNAVDAITRMLVFLMLTLKQILIKAIPFSLLLGPLGLISISVTSLSQGLVSFLYFIANFSLAIGLVNLFPIPGLDGGSIVLIVLEKIRGKPLAIAVELLLYRLALIAFFVFLAQLISNDLQRLAS